MRIVAVLIGLIISLASFEAFSQLDQFNAVVTKVKDGDTVVVSRQGSGATSTCRLADIDAPEHNPKKSSKTQPFGPQATKRLEELILNSKVSILVTNKDRWNRSICEIYVGETYINAEMVRGGYAWVFTRYNTKPFLPAVEALAKLEKRGLWGTDNPQAPWEWRRK